MLSKLTKLFKIRVFILFFVLTFFCYFILFDRLKSLVFHIHEFKNYEKDALNPKCPALKESEWKIYKNLTTPNVFVTENERSKLSIKDLGFVSFTSKDHMKEAIASCKSIILHPELKNVPLTVFLHDDVNQNLTNQYQIRCPIAKVIKFPFDEFPNNVRFLKHYRFKPIYSAMALKNHKILLSFDTSVIFQPNLNFTDLISSSIKNNPLDVTLLSPSNHKMFPTTHPKMFDCFPKIDIEKTKIVPQFQGGLILWVGSESGWKIMRRLVECSLKPECMSPIGAALTCNMGKIYSNPGRFSGCHRFDQAAINLILYENSNFNFTLYQRTSNYFKISRIL